jgi:hypothetical protein
LVCPAGVFVVQCELRGADLHVERTVDISTPLHTPDDAGHQLVRALASAGARNARVAIALRGFGMVHHLLHVPDSGAGTGDVVEDELRRLEPDLRDAVVSWAPVSTSPVADAADAPFAQLAGAVPASTIAAVAQRLEEAGHALVHLTALPASLNRLAREFDRDDDVSALVLSLPDGPAVGYFIGGALRFVVEPPSLPASDQAAALAEEVELGAAMVRQQFLVSRVDHVLLVGAVDAIDDAEPALSARLGVPVQRLALRDLSAASHAAVGAVLDASSESPLAFTALPPGQMRSTTDLPGLPQRRGLIPAAAALMLVAAATIALLWTRNAPGDSDTNPSRATPNPTSARQPSSLARVDSERSIGPARPPTSSASANSRVSDNLAVAPPANAPTVRPADAGRRLTALLIADDRRVAVVDDSLVSVGDLLRDGSRVSAIQPDGVWIIEKSGKWRLLTLSRAGR